MAQQPSQKYATCKALSGKALQNCKLEQVNYIVILWSLCKPNASVQNLYKIH